MCGTEAIQVGIIAPWLWPHGQLQEESILNLSKFHGSRGPKMSKRVLFTGIA